MPPGHTSTAGRNTPGRPTLFRMRIVDEQAYQLVCQGIARLKPLLWIRDNRKVKRIESARTIEDLVDLTPLATGLGEPAWSAQMRAYGPEVLPTIADTLIQANNLQDEDTRHRIQAVLVAELRWRGEAGARVLLSVFPELDRFQQSLACVALGLSGFQPASATVWEFYQQVRHAGEEACMVGALWGLLDLQDARVPGELARLLEEGRSFYELCGFLSRLGDARAVLPLLSTEPNLDEPARIERLMALVAIAHRIGREALADEIEKGAAGEDRRRTYEELADLVLAKPASLAEDYFALFYY